MLLSVLGILIVIISIYGIHIFLGQEIVNGYYEASNRYIKILENGERFSISKYRIGMVDNFNFISHYQKGVPKYNPKKIGENGSPPYFWPLGGKAINYRWEKREKVKYLYLQGNPFVWFFGLSGVLVGLMLVWFRLIKLVKIEKKNFEYLVILISLYFTYMVVMVLIFMQRVMYLYHYFIPLIFSFILFFIVINIVFKKILKTKKFFLGILLGIFIIFTTYLFFSPLTYYQSLNTMQFELRQWISIWG